MKKPFALLMVACLGLFTVGCTPKAEDPAPVDETVPADTAPVDETVPADDTPSLEVEEVETIEEVPAE